MATNKIKILVVDSEEDIGKLTVSHIKGLGYSGLAVGSAKQAFECLDEFNPDIVLSDINLGDERGGEKLLGDLRSKNPSILRIAMISKGLDYLEDYIHFQNSTGIVYLLNKTEMFENDDAKLREILGLAATETYYRIRRWGEQPLHKYNLSELNIVKNGGSLIDILTGGKVNDGRDTKASISERTEIVNRCIDGLIELHENGGVILFVGGGAVLDVDKAAKKNKLKIAMKYRMDYNLSEEYWGNVENTLRVLDKNTYNVNKYFFLDLIRKRGVNAEVTDNLYKYGQDEASIRTYLNECIPIMWTLEPYNTSIRGDQSDTLTVEAAVRLGTQKVFFVKNIKWVAEWDPLIKKDRFPRGIKHISALSLKNLPRISEDGTSDHLMEDSAVVYLSNLKEDQVIVHVHPAWDPPTIKNYLTDNYSRIHSGKDTKLEYFPKKN